MNVSVIIPTRNRPASCSRLLKALVPQTRGLDSHGGQVEVIVVDDHSNAAARSQLTAQLAEFTSDGLRLVFTDSSSGPSAARNFGIAEAGGDLLIFLDDDCIPGPGFLNESVRLHIKYPHILLINGNLRALRNDSISRFWFYYYNHAFNCGSGEIYRIHRVSSGNFSIKRTLAESFYPLFDEQLPSREDYDLYLRLDHASIPVFKADSVFATIECRKTFRGFLKQRAWYANGEIWLRRKHGEAFLRQAQSGLYPKRSPAFIHIYLLLYCDRKIRAFRQRRLTR
jgi:mycofactocin glycosyltransferase